MNIVVGDNDIHGLFNGKLYAYRNGYPFYTYDPRLLPRLLRRTGRGGEIYFFDVPVERVMRDYVFNELYRTCNGARIIVHDHHGGYVVSDFEVYLYKSCYDMIVSTVPDVDRDVAIVVSILDGDVVHASHTVVLVSGVLEYMLHRGKYLEVVDMLIRHYRSFDDLRKEVLDRANITYLSLINWVKKNIVGATDKYVMLSDKTLIPLYLALSKAMGRRYRRRYALYVSREKGIYTLGSSPEAPISAYMVLYAVYNELGGRLLGRSSYATLINRDEQPETVMALINKYL